MTRILIYTTPHCVKCDATKRAFHKEGVSHLVDVIPLTAEKVDEFRRRGHMTAPIVHATDGEEWSDYRRERITQLAQRLLTKEQTP